MYIYTYIYIYIHTYIFHRQFTQIYVHIDVSKDPLVLFCHRSLEGFWQNIILQWQMKCVVTMWVPWVWESQLHIFLITSGSDATWSVVFLGKFTRTLDVSIPEAGLSFLHQGAVYLKQPGTQPVLLRWSKNYTSPGLGDLLRFPMILTFSWGDPY